MPKLSIAKLYDHPSVVKINRYRIVEHVRTIDGTRDRFTNMSFQTLKAARAFIRRRRRGAIHA